MHHSHFIQWNFPRSSGREVHPELIRLLKPIPGQGMRDEMKVGRPGVVCCASSLIGINDRVLRYEAQSGKSCNFKPLFSSQACRSDLLPSSQAASAAIEI